MRAIVAVDSNWAIGNKGKLLVSIPSDHKMFRTQTKDKIVIYGRKTLETFPMARPLDQRVNIIFSRNPAYEVKNAETVHSVEELQELLRTKYAEYDSDDVYVIGGESIYRQLLPLCDTVIVTRIDFDYEADAFFQNLDQNPEWECVEEGEEQTYFDVAFHFDRYERVSGGAGAV